MTKMMYALFYVKHVLFSETNYNICSSNAATRKDEVCTIRSKFPNKLPVRYLFNIKCLKKNETTAFLYLRNFVLYFR